MIPDIRKGNCPLCDHNQIIESTLQDFTSPTYQQPKGITSVIERGLFHDSPDAGRPIGVIAVYTCASCGYLQMFAKGADKVPISTEHGTRMITGVSRTTPYR